MGSSNGGPSASDVGRVWYGDLAGPDKERMWESHAGLYYVTNHVLGQNLPNLLGTAICYHSMG